ncbi:hypothetical protein CXF95_17145 [Paraglaciecola sp. MB-3u-78]|nr:hypothetical protein CXF95_17145 [Paraglaciecola sp. MB-3u-78]
MFLKTYTSEVRTDAILFMSLKQSMTSGPVYGRKGGLNDYQNPFYRAPAITASGTGCVKTLS